ncbi:hypothetical protein [Shinella sp. HZN7]|uniref:hypothetical protein n=1 Tax=Shinella sp. (strain HZN7) TaxID=879274 RepID=UPI0007DA6173|nr:hypothetical protein [Shinella sp. HZN7]ANH03879.1 hypothetical protein shn_07360 [Shinella sp. HZN7]
MTRHALATALTLLFLAGPPAFAQESPVAETITFVVSTGFWEEPVETDEEDAETAAETQEPAALRRGYYKLVAARQPDGTAQVHLQQIEATAEGPKIASSTVLEEFSAMKPYVTDIRPENSSGITTQPGLFATVYLKTDPKAAEPEGWTVLIDDLGEIKIERATN